LKVVGTIADFLLLNSALSKESFSRRIMRAVKISKNLLLGLFATVLLYNHVPFSYSFMTPSISKRVSTVDSSFNICFFENGRSRDVSILYSKSKKSGSDGGATTQSSSKKIQVKLLKHVAGTDHAGQVIQVAPAFYNNKLRPTKSAVIITDDEVKQERINAVTAEKKHNEIAIELKNILDSTKVVFERKSGPDGHLFGAVGPKMILEEIFKTLQTDEHKDFLNEKSVKITFITNDDTNDVVKGDIKHTGSYTSKLSLTPDVIGKVAVDVKPEKHH
jgi:ribosomal protein L9